MPAKKKVAEEVKVAEEKVEKTAKKAAETVKKAPAKAKAAAKSTAKKVEKAAETVAADVKTGVEKVKKPAAKKAAPKNEVIIQSPMGGVITPAEILAKVGPVDSVYVRVDANKLYWVKGEETGAVDIW